MTRAAAPPAPDRGDREFLGHPLGLSVLFGTEMGERFCYYGMRAILTYYMVQYLFLGDRPDHVIGYATLKSLFESVSGPLGVQPLAARVYGLFTAGTYLTGIAGGAIADRVLGQRFSVIIGAVTMAVGEFLLTDQRLFLIGLFVLVTGNGFFKPNIATQVGGLYRRGDARIDRAYSIFYVGINLGGFLAPIVTGFVAHMMPGEPRWNYGFMAAGVGMLVSLAIFLAGQPALPPDVRRRRLAAEGAGASGTLTADDKRAVAALCAVAVFNLFFWGVYEQQGISIALMASDYTNLQTPFGRLDAEDVQSFNSFFIFAFTPLVIALWTRQARTGREPSAVTKMAWGCVLAGVSYAMLLIPAMAMDAGHKVSWVWLLVATAVLTMGELYLSPVGLSLFNRAAPAKLASLMMAVNYLSNAVGNYLAGYLGGFWSGMSKVNFFLMLTVISFATAGAIAAVGVVLRPVLNKRMNHEG
jgi:POT family proton-dependent oligopeptide transporter